jgi:hypothetical protein
MSSGRENVLGNGRFRPSLMVDPSLLIDDETADIAASVAAEDLALERIILRQWPRLDSCEPHSRIAMGATRVIEIDSDVPHHVLS